MAESEQRREMRTRTQRVHILCDVHTDGLPDKIDLPFVAGVLADLSGQPEKPLPDLDKREFEDLGKANFNEFLKSQAPRLAFTVENRLGDPTKKLSVELTFSSLEDFEPDRVAAKIEPLDRLLKLRKSLEEIRTRVLSKGGLRLKLNEILSTPELREALAKALGVEPPSSLPDKS